MWLRITVWLASACCLTMAGCASDPASRHDPSIGSNASTPVVHARGVAAVTDSEDQARVVGTLLNRVDEPVRLVEVAAKAEKESVQASLSGPVTIAPNEEVRLAHDAGIMLRSPDLPEGRFIELRFTFDAGPDLTLNIPVEPPDGPYSGIEVTEPPDGTVAPTGERNGTPFCEGNERQ